MKDIVVYIHGKNGSAAEAARYRRLFADSDVLGFDYEARTPWEAKEEFAPYFESILKSRKPVTIVANSIGAFFAMHALQDMRIKKVYFISPIVNMENLILNMLSQANASEEKLRDKGKRHKIRRKTIAQISLLRQRTSYLLDGADAYFIRQKRRSSVF